CGGVVLSLHPQPDGSVIGGTDGFGMVRTVNDGQNWQYAGGSETALRVGGDGTGTAYAIAAGDGLRRSFDGGVSWTALRWIDADVHHLAPLPNGRVVAFTDRYYGAHAYTPSGTWTDLGLDGNEVYRAESAPGGLLYALVHRGTFGTAIVRSTDGGATWTTRRAFQYYTSFAVGADGVLLASGHDGYERSTDGGATWTVIATEREPSEMHHAGGGLLFSYSGGYPDALLRSTDNGLTWTNLGSPGTVGALSLPRLQAVTRMADGALLAADEDGLMRSDDEGEKWTAVEGSPDHIVAFVHDASGALWAARDEGFFSAAVGSGVWRSGDGGASWATAGFDGVRVHTLAVGAGNTVLAGTATGVYVRSGGVVATSPDPAPTASALQVAPNPVRDRAAVTLTLDRAQTATVAVYDALGRRVAMLHDGALTAGTHALTFDTAALPAGLYVVRASGDGLALTHRATVVR
ncbi:MAG TPA: T9SS type A sorting domain-containing protein, partial [Rhodothermales bacterium]|nr:T9SS type A sorting domain-containing protein [Rhodothermales bacterium]